jgi:hypothetical protein
MKPCDWYKCVITPILIIVLVCLAGYTFANSGDKQYISPSKQHITVEQEDQKYEIKLNQKYLVYTLRYLNKPETFGIVTIRKIDDKFIVMELQRGDIVWVPLTNVAKIFKYDEK